MKAPDTAAPSWPIKPIPLWFVQLNRPKVGTSSQGHLGCAAVGGGGGGEGAGGQQASLQLPYAAAGQQASLQLGFH